MLEQIEDELLRLELLARNFHEMIDMEPLFLHVLLKIVRKIPVLKDPTSIDGDSRKNDSSFSSRKINLLNRWKQTSDNLKWDEFKREMVRKKLDHLFKIARRITKKQIESLSSVQGRQRLTIDLSETCQGMRPSHFINKECKEKVKGYEKEFSMKIQRVKKREFKVMVDHSYPKWNQVRVRVEAKKTNQEKKSDPSGKNVHEARFWLSYFDFPLAENSFLSDKERYSVVLDEIDREKQEAHISLLYFPASYAGLKEKSFSQQNLISTLLEGKSLN